MKLASRLLPLMVLVLVFALPSHAQTGRITGIVRGFEGEPLQGAVLVLNRQGIEQQREVETDATGAYLITVPSGTYRVSLEIDGRPMTFVDGLEVTTGSEAEADFDLAELADNDAAREVMAANARTVAVTEAFDLGRAALEVGNYDEAIEHFTLASESDDTQHVILANLAEALIGAGRYDEAAENYNKAILMGLAELTPIEAGSYYNNLGVALGNAGRTEEAIEALERTAELNPGTAGQAYFNLGAVLTNRGRSAEAVEAFNRSIEFDPDNAEAYYQLGLSYFGSAETIPDAIPVLEKYLELAPDSPNAEAARGLIAAAGGSL